jgi:hypothetical protein
LGDATGCGFTSGPGDIVGQSPNLGPLQDNGGSTRTHALLAGSPALEAGAGCPAKDQRGVDRPQGSACDIGALEVPVARFQSSTYSVAEDAGQAFVPVSLDGKVPFTVTVDYATSNGTALSGAHYTAASGTLPFSPNALTASFSVPIIDNAVYSPGRWLNVSLSAGLAVVVQSPLTATLAIVDDEFGMLLPTLARDFNPFAEVEPNDTTGLANGPLESGRSYFGRNSGGNDPDFFFFEMLTPGTITVQLIGLVFDPLKPEANGQLQLRQGARTQPVAYAGAPPYHLQYTGTAGIYYVLVFTPAAYAGGQYILIITYP